jgi:uncharacterized protein
MTLRVDHEKVEYRVQRVSEIRLDDIDQAPKIVGYAAVFNTWADIGGGLFKESIKPGAFRKTIKENDIRALIDHKSEQIIGRNKAGTLKLREDDKGLAVEIFPTPTTYANDLIMNMRAGNISQMSFGFQVNKQEINYERDERVLEDVTLFDVSVVSFPAYESTTAQVRSLFQRHSLPPEPNKAPDPWAAFDAIIARLKAGEELTEEELRQIAERIPSLPVPPAKHTGTPPEPPAKHSADDTRTVDVWTAWEIQKGIFAN